jgi:hypothetical protein
MSTTLWPMTPPALRATQAFWLLRSQKRHARRETRGRNIYAAGI